MQLSNIPGKLVLPWATSGNKNNIPVASQIGITAGAASLTDGFPPLTMTPVAAGGVPPSGLDMNGILYEMSTILRWANAGGGYAYDSVFANDSNVDGYPKGARVMRSDGMGYWFNTVDNNTTDPEAAGAAAAGWVPDYQAGATSVAMSGSSVTLTPAQYGKPLIVITGALSANLNLIFPALAQGWTIINNTTGGYSITAKTASGSGVTLGTISQIVGDGTNIYAANPDSVQIVTNVATLRNIAPNLSRRIQTRGYYTDGDGGGAQYFPKVGAAPGTYVDNGGTVIVPNGGDGSTAWLLDISGGVIHVKQFGAKGDGVTDDTTRTQAAATAIAPFMSLHFNAGDYIIDTACLLFRGKTDINIYGDGNATKIRVSGQTDSNAIKQDYHCTFAIDQCSRVNLSNMVIESKGANYGNTDAYGGLAGGDPRTNAAINYGGSALLIARSDNISVRNVIARRCGSVGVVYASSCEDIVFENCFANARSLGYAGFAADNWCDATVKTKRTYKFVECRVNKENATYSSKGGIVLEGDEITQRLLNVEVIGGVYEDCAIGGDFVIGGAAVTAMETRLAMNGVISKNCYMGVSYTKRGGAVDYTKLHVDGCQFLGNLVAGAYVNISVATGGSDVAFNATQMITNSTSVWAAGTNDAVKVSSGITTGGYQNDSIKVSGCTISGGQRGLYAIDRTTFEVNGSNISGIDGAVSMYGGGTLVLDGNKVETSGAGSIPVFMTTANKAVSASYNSKLYVTGNHIKAAADTSTDYAIKLTGNSALFSETQIKNNTVNMGVINVSKGSATLFDVDEILLNTTRRVMNYGLVNTNTFVEFTLPKEFQPQYAYAVGSDDVSRAVLSTTSNYGGTRGLVRIVLSGDVRTAFIATNNVRATLMQ